MELKSGIMEALKAAMKDRDQVRVAALRLIRDAIQKAEINEKKDFDDAGVVSILSRLSKQRKESIEAYGKGGREDLVQREQKELEIIKEFMPEPMTPEELEELIDLTIERTGANSPSDMGKVMKALKGQYEGRASGKEVSDKVRNKLTASAGS